MGLRNDAYQSEKTDNPYLMWWLKRYAYMMLPVVAALTAPAYWFMYAFGDRYFDYAPLADHFITASAAFLIYYGLVNTVWIGITKCAYGFMWLLWSVNTYVMLFGADYGNYFSVAMLCVATAYFALFIYCVTYSEK